ncbi:hypothetical protein KCU61_g403, partial [Aureobasidium melanogenum]
MSVVRSNLLALNGSCVQIDQCAFSVGQEGLHLTAVGSLCRVLQTAPCYLRQAMSGTNEDDLMLLFSSLA